MKNADQEYLRIVDEIRRNGKYESNRTGVNTIGIFGAQAKFDLFNSFPLLTTKKLSFHNIAHELLWFLSGSTNIKYLVDNNVHIWNDNCYSRYAKTPLEKIPENERGNFAPHWEHLTKELFIERIKTDEAFAKKWGELGEGTYGGMWRAFPARVQPIGTVKEDYMEVRGWSVETVDQIQKVIDKLHTNPTDRRLIVSAWHPYWVDHCVLPPCHCLFQFHTEAMTEAERIEYFKHKWFDITEVDQNDPKNLDLYHVPTRKLNCQLYQRSCDTFLGVPYNIASYALLTYMIAHCVNMAPGVFTHTFGDLHIYEDHLEQLTIQASREPKRAPQLIINPKKKNLWDITRKDLELVGYDPHPAIQGKMAV